MTHSNVTDLVKESSLEAQKRLGLFNPMYESFNFEYEGQEYTLDAQKITRLPQPIAKYVLRHLRDAVINDRGYNGSIYEAREKAEKEILA